MISFRICTTRLRSVCVLLSSVAGLLLLIQPTGARAQCQGNAGEHVAYNSSNQACFGSTAYVDASALGYTNSNTICNIIYNIVNSSSYPPTGEVIDARGLVSGVNANFTCANNESPWLSGSNYVNVPSVVLLPAGTITTTYTWVLPDRTSLIGQGGGSSSSVQVGTLITAGNNFTGPAGSPPYNPLAPIAMIQFGDPGFKTCGPGGQEVGVCFHITVEDLALNGGGQSIDGILNMDSQELTYAKRVSFFNFAGVGLQVGAPCNGVNTCEYYAQGQNSGPYEQIYYSGSGTCAQIYGAGIRGIHGITCVGSSSPAAGILLDSSSNTLEDVTLSGFKDGIKIGSLSTSSPTQSESWNDALINIHGSAINNLIHICGSQVTQPCLPASTPAPQDLNLLSVSSTGGTTIQDDVTNTPLTDSHVGIYALGEPQATLATGTGNSRFTTSSNLPSWFVGTAQLGSGITSLTCPAAAQGSIYTATTGSAANGTLWGCVGGFWTFIQ
jgi:hypothetical protein